ncbi:hypothetical protein BDV18DRAFT_155437 [Aspergillus unguis]
MNSSELEAGEILLAGPVTHDDYLLRELKKAAIPKAIDELFELPDHELGSGWQMIRCMLAAKTPLEASGLNYACNGPADAAADVNAYGAAVVTATLGLLTFGSEEVCLNHPPERRKRRVFNVCANLASFLGSGDDKTFFQDKVGQSKAQFMQECHALLVNAGIQQLNESRDLYENERKASVPRSGSPLALETNTAKSAVLRGDITDIITKVPMLEYTVRYLMVNAAKATKNVAKNLKSVCSMWCYLHDCLQGFRMYGPSVTIYHVMAQYNILALLSDDEEDWTLVESQGGQTLLHWAAFHGAADSVECIISRCLKANTRDTKYEEFLFARETDHGRTAFDIAAAQGNWPIFDQLLSFQKRLPFTGRNDFSSTSKNGYTVLHHAVIGGNPRIVEALLRYGVNWRVQSENGHTPLQLAMRLAEKQFPLPLALKSIVRLLKDASYADVGLASQFDPSTKSVDGRFEAVCTVFASDGMKTTRISVAELLEGNDIRGSAFDCTWIHLPANNMKWAELLILRVLQTYSLGSADSLRDIILRRELWTDRHIRGTERSYISFMRHGFETTPHPDTNIWSLFMPYMHWETQQKQTVMEHFLLCKYAQESKLPLLEELETVTNSLLNKFKRNDGISLLPSDFDTQVVALLGAVEDCMNNPSSAAACDGLLERMKEHCEYTSRCDPDIDLLHAYASNESGGHPVHPRRTLDQSFYYSLSSTAQRNQDQVVSRHGQSESKSRPIVLMVDQLWLWKLDNVVVTCFPQRREFSRNDPDRFGATDVLESILASLKEDEEEEEEPIDVSEFDGGLQTRQLIARIISECVACFDPPKELEDEFKIFDTFNDSINRVSDAEIRCYERFLGSLENPGKIDIKEEFYILREIKDIMEELRMLKKICEDQRTVLGQVQDLLAQEMGQEFEPEEFESEEFDPEEFEPKEFEPKEFEPAHNAVEQYIEEIDLMQQEAERVNQEINTLMDLRQRHATLWEAQSTGRQGNTIMVFTVVTILFLPASFMASFFALPVVQFPRVDDENMNLSYVVKWLLIFTVPVAVFFISTAFHINEVLEILSGVVIRLKDATLFGKMRCLSQFWESLGTKLSIWKVDIEWRSKRVGGRRSDEEAARGSNSNWVGEDKR